jgi:hypothetical protein
MLAHAYERVSRTEVAGLFGERFADSILALEPGSWHGSIESGYGVHAVIVDFREEGRLPALEEVRRSVQREWENERRDQARERFYEDLLSEYEIDIQWPDSLMLEPGA